MTQARIIVVGGGLAGLYAAFLLESSNVDDYLLLEARPCLGGRVVSASSSNPDMARVDLGATWFWPELQPEFAALVQYLGLRTFAQPTTGEALFERAAQRGPERLSGYPASPESMRLAGGMGALLDALKARVDSRRVFTGHAVEAIHASSGGLRIDARRTGGAAVAFAGQHLLLAMPPRLAASMVRFEPELPAQLAAQWTNTATWMAPHAKYVAMYDTPFWRSSGLSGDAFSHVGPMVEIHDAGPEAGAGALFGFVGTPARVRRGIPVEQLRALCRAQMVRLFGPQAATPVQEWLQDWSSEQWTAVPADSSAAAGGHAAAPASTAATGPWAGCMSGIGSEWSPEFPGYLAGAIDAARRAVERLMETM